MKRSKINASIREMEAKIQECRFALPPFCSFTPKEWEEKGHEYDEIRENMLGWDITDYGLGDFDKVGFALITLRNGNLHNAKYSKTYAEKLLYLKEGQSAPMHFHWNKMEDIGASMGCDGAEIFHTERDPLRGVVIYNASFFFSTIIEL